MALDDTFRCVWHWANAGRRPTVWSNTKMTQSELVLDIEMRCPQSTAIVLGKDVLIVGGNTWGLVLLRPYLAE